MNIMEELRAVWVVFRQGIGAMAPAWNWCLVKTELAQVTLGGGVIAVLQLTQVKDVVSILVGVTTIVCLVTTTFFRQKARKRAARKDCPFGPWTPQCPYGKERAKLQSEACNL